MTETEGKTTGQKLLFNKWDASEVKVNDPSLMRYVTLTSMIIPHTCGKFSRQEFGKSNMMIVERLINGSTIIILLFPNSWRENLPQV